LKLGRLEDQLNVALMKTAKPKGRRTTQYELVEQAWLTLETCEELIQERRAQEEKLEMYIELRRQRQLRDALK
jgi:hypothetical protein